MVRQLCHTCVGVLTVDSTWTRDTNVFSLRLLSVCNTNTADKGCHRSASKCARETGRESKHAQYCGKKWMWLGEIDIHRVGKRLYNKYWNSKQKGRCGLVKSMNIVHKAKEPYCCKSRGRTLVQLYSSIVHRYEH